MELDLWPLQHLKRVRQKVEMDLELSILGPMVMVWMTRINPIKTALRTADIRYQWELWIGKVNRHGIQRQGLTC